MGLTKDFKLPYDYRHDLFYGYATVRDHIITKCSVIHACYDRNDIVVSLYLPNDDILEYSMIIEI